MCIFAEIKKYYRTDRFLKRVRKTYRSTLTSSRARYFDATLVSGFDRRGLKFSIDSPIFVASRRLTRPLDVAEVDARAVFQNVPVGIKTGKRPFSIENPTLELISE